MASVFISYIGINNYSEKPLNGCIIDVLRLDKILFNLCGDTLNYKPAYFLGPKQSDYPSFDLTEFPRGSRIKSMIIDPSYKNISEQAFSHFSAAKPGDICIFYYSGHGSQVLAPPEFKHLEPSGNCQTLVLIDSRLPGKRDLLDKELAWLSWNTFQNKSNVLFYSIFDCCHAGSMLRSKSNTPSFLSKAVSPLPAAPETKSLLGFAEGYFKGDSNMLTFDQVSHAQISACLPHEVSVDRPMGSVFTAALIETINYTSGNMNWQDLLSLTGDLMLANGSKQHVATYATDEAFLTQPFPGYNSKIIHGPFSVRYDGNNKEWRISAGSIHGLKQKNKQLKPIVYIPNVKKIVPVKKIFSNYSLIDDPKLKKTKIYPANILYSGGALITIFISPQLSNDKKNYSKLLSAYQAIPYPAFILNEKSADLFINYSSTPEYELLSKKNNQVLMRDKDPLIFIQNLQQIAIWHQYREMQHSSSIFSAADLDVFINYGLFNLGEKASNHKENMHAFRPLRIPKIPGKKLFFQLGISLAKVCKFQSCYISALYFTQGFKLSATLIAGDNNQLVKENSIFIPGQELLLSLDAGALYPDLIKIILSEFPIDLSIYNINGFQSDTDRARKKNKQSQNEEWCILDYEIIYN